MRRKHRRKNQKKIIIFSMIGLVCMFSVGYAAFSSEFLISGKGTIIQKEGSLTSESLKSLAVTSGDGLYADTYEKGRYIYRGKNVDNYIYFGTSSNELWRIISIETDGTLKIIKDEVIPDNANMTSMAYDTANARTSEKNTYCVDLAGCGVFAAIDGTFSTPSGTWSGTVIEDSTIKTYLNGEYYASLSSTYTPYIQTHTFNIGAVEMLDVSGGDTIEKNIAGEKMYTWTGNIGLINVTDVLKASTNSACTSATEQFNQLNNNEVSVCNDSWLFTGADIEYWTINAHFGEVETRPALTWVVGDYAELGGLGTAFASISFGARPVLYLKSDITLKGSGTSEEPYEIQL